jgi:hypothetical protein
MQQRALFKQRAVSTIASAAKRGYYYVSVAANYAYNLGADVWGLAGKYSAVCLLYLSWVRVRVRVRVRVWVLSFYPLWCSCLLAPTLASFSRIVLPTIHCPPLDPFLTYGAV